MLVDQQFWFLGHDIQHADGNALVRFGFVRTRSHHPGGTTCYRLPLGVGHVAGDVNAQLVCWGFAAYIGPVLGNSDVAGDAANTRCGSTTAGGIIITRHAHTPLLLRAPLRLPLHTERALPQRSSPQGPEEWCVANRGLAMAATVFATYERWAGEHLGAAHRARALALLPRHKARRFVPHPDLADQWDRVSRGMS